MGTRIIPNYKCRFILSALHNLCLSCFWSFFFLQKTMEREVGRGRLRVVGVGGSDDGGGWGEDLWMISFFLSSVFSPLYFP